MYNMTKIHQTYYLNLSAKNVKILRTIAFLFRLKQLLQFTTVLLLLKRHTLNKMFSVSTERPELRKICQYKNLVEIQRSLSNRKYKIFRIASLLYRRVLIAIIA